MFDQAPQTNGHRGDLGDFFANLDGPVDYLRGDLITKDEKRFYLEFWHAQECDFQSGTKMSGKLPHVWVSISGDSPVEFLDPSLIAHYTVKAILSYIVLYEAVFGREPETLGLMEKPRDHSFSIG